MAINAMNDLILAFAPLPFGSWVLGTGIGRLSLRLWSQSYSSGFRNLNLIARSTGPLCPSSGCWLRMLRARPALGSWRIGVCLLLVYLS